MNLNDQIMWFHAAGKRQFFVSTKSLSIKPLWFHYISGVSVCWIPIISIIPFHALPGLPPTTCFDTGFICFFLCPMLTLLFDVHCTALTLCLPPICVWRVIANLVMLFAPLRTNAIKWISMFCLLFIFILLIFSLGDCIDIWCTIHFLDVHGTRYCCKPHHITGSLGGIQLHSIYLLLFLHAVYRSNFELCFGWKQQDVWKALKCSHSIFLSIGCVNQMAVLSWFTMIIILEFNW